MQFERRKGGAYTLLRIISMKCFITSGYIIHQAHLHEHDSQANKHKREHGSNTKKKRRLYSRVRQASVSRKLKGGCLGRPEVFGTREDVWIRQECLEKGEVFGRGGNLTEAKKCVSYSDAIGL